MMKNGAPVLWQGVLMLKAMTLKQSYALIFALLIFWASFAYYTMHSLIQSQSYYAKLINLSGKQRMLSQKTAFYVHLHAKEGKQRYLSELRKLMETLQTDYGYIVSNLKTKQSKELYFKKGGINERIERYMELLRRYVQTRDAALLPEVLNYSKKILPDLDRAVSLFQKESEAKTRELQNRELFIYVATVLTILLEAHFFARPIIDRIRMKFEVFRKRLDRQYRKILLQAKVYNHTKDGIIITDRENRIVDCNPSFSKITGYTRNEVLGQDPSFLKSGKHDQLFYQKMWADIKERGRFSGEVINKAKDGSEYIQEVDIFTIYDNGGAVNNYVGIISDITQKYETQKQLNFLANYDALTKIPNRNLMYEILNKAMVAARRTGKSIAILYLDLDDFKLVNDSLGHSYGDRLLVDVVKLLQKLLRKSDTICRVGGDEFIFIIEGVERKSDMDVLAQKILDILAKPFELERMHYTISGSIGISFYPDDTDDVDELIKFADMAMYKAKNSGKNKFHYYDKRIQQKLLEKLRFQTSMEKALERDEFIIHLQPKIDPHANRVYSLEALVRWRQGDHLVAPGMFIPIAEESDLILKIGDRVLQQVIALLHRWQHNPVYKKIPVSVNISPKQVFYSDIVGIINDLEPEVCNNLIFEITEHSLVDSFEKMREFIGECSRLGVQTAIDDFGTGYSSLMYLKKMPIDYIKIDKVFVDNILTDREDEVIVKTILDMARNMSLQTIVEGVETQPQANYLTALRADILQGFLYSKPLGIKECERFIDTYPPV